MIQESEIVEGKVYKCLTISEETNWFLKCVELNKYISLEDFRKLQPKHKELNPYNI